MADKGQVDRLKAGVEEWNRWRKVDGARIQIDLRRADLGDANLIAAILNGADLPHTSFGSTDLSGVEGLESIHHLGPSTLDHHTLENPACYLWCSFVVAEERKGGLEASVGPNRAELDRSQARGLHSDYCPFK